MASNEKQSDYTAPREGPKKSNNTSGQSFLICALVLGVVALFIAIFFGLFGLIPGIPALALSVLSLINAGKQDKKKLWPLIAGGLSLVALLIAIFTGVCFHKWAPAACTAPETCEKCGKTRGEALGHDWEDAACTTPKTCRRCGLTEGKALGHDYEYTVTKEPTCALDGEETGVCKRCKDQVTEVLPATGEHTVEEWIVTKEPTCYEEGAEEGTCTVCGETFTNVLEMTEHLDDGSWVVLRDATENEPGLRETYCLVCGQTVQHEEFSLSDVELSALRTARLYVNYSYKSRTALIRQLEMEGYETGIATAAVDRLGMNWAEEAAGAAWAYIRLGNFNHDSLVAQLQRAGFTEEEAVYAAAAVGM